MKLSWISYLHPLFFASYPPVALLAYNIEEIKIEAGLRALISIVLTTLLFLIIIFLIIKSWEKAALITSLSLILFFSYGHLYHYLRLELTNGMTLIHHRILLPIYILLFIGGVFWVIFRGNNRQILNRCLTIIGCIALLIPLTQIGKYSILSTATRLNSLNEQNQNNLHAPSNQTPPDIYYIILDAYSRDDVLDQFYGYDNSNFLSRLQDMGFYIGRCSQSNYAQTQLSLASSLNFNYLENLNDNFRPGSTSRVGLSEFIRHNQSRQELEKIGYTTYAFETGFKTTEWDDADFFLTPQGEVLGISKLITGITDFELMLIRSSGGLFLVDSVNLLPKIIQPDFNNPNRIHRDRILFTLKKFEELAKTPGPKYVFAHVVIPHPPYVFGPNGEFTDYEVNDDPGYINQLIYLNQRLIPILEEIINTSKVAPIIIIQADHGGINTPPASRTKILNAYFLPGDGKKNLYPTISPVNSFRIIFDYYLGGKYSLLKDISYFSVYQHPYDYSIITDNRVGCSGQ